MKPYKLVNMGSEESSETKLLLSTEQVEFLQQIFTLLNYDIKRYAPTLSMEAIPEGE